MSMTAGASDGSYWHDLARQKLERVLGAKAGVVIAEVLEELGVENLDTPEHLVRFGEALARRGGFMAALGTSLQTQAMLHQTRAKL